MPPKAIVPSKGAKKAVKPAKGVAKGEGKRRKKRKETYSVYIYKVLKTSTPRYGQFQVKP